jgi:hypothetical protein
MPGVDVNIVVRRIELQLGAFEKTLSEARIRIDHIERHLAKRIKEVRQCIVLMAHTKDVMVLTKIIDMLDDIERIVDKLNSVDITPVGANETSLEGLMDEEYEKIESFVF